MTISVCSQTNNTRLLIDSRDCFKPIYGILQIVYLTAWLYVITSYKDCSMDQVVQLPGWTNGCIVCSVVIYLWWRLLLTTLSAHARDEPSPKLYNDHHALIECIIFLCFYSNCTRRMEVYCWTTTWWQISLLVLSLLWSLAKQRSKQSSSSSLLVLGPQPFSRNLASSFHTKWVDNPKLDCTEPVLYLAHAYAKPRDQFAFTTINWPVLN